MMRKAACSKRKKLSTHDCSTGNTDLGCENESRDGILAKEKRERENKNEKMNKEKKLSRWLCIVTIPTNPASVQRF